MIGATVQPIRKRRLLYLRNQCFTLALLRSGGVPAAEPSWPAPSAQCEFDIKTRDLSLDRFTRMMAKPRDGHVQGLGFVRN